MILDKKFILAYSDIPNGLLHKYGTTSVEVKEYIKNVEEKIANRTITKKMSILD